MPQSNAVRTQHQEGANTFRSKDLMRVMQEIDGRFNSANCWSTITQTAKLITRIEYFTDAGKTDKAIQKDYTYVTVSGLERLATITATYYNKDTSIDSTVTTTINRVGIEDADYDEGDIEGCDSPFSTTESEKI